MASVPNFRAVTAEECETTLSVGDFVRSFDFENCTDCYVEGELVSIGKDVLEGCPRYRIRVTSRMFDGQPQANFSEFVFPPLNGTPYAMRGYCNGVRKVGDFQ